jgi:hypothetical protein
MIDYGEIEVFIADELQTLFGSNVKVVPLPENQEAYKPSVDKPHITVAFMTAGEYVNLDTSTQSQEEEVTIQIEIQSRTLRGVKGVYTLRKAVANHLQGLDIPNSTFVYLKKAMWAQTPFENGTWCLCQLLTVRCMAMQDEEEEILGTLTRITLQNYVSDVVTKIRTMPDLNIPEQ